MKNVAKITIFVSVIFLLAGSIWYSPVLFKGYTPWGGGPTLARNLAQTGIYGAENELGVILSSNLVKEQAHVSAYGNKLTAELYGKIFKTWGELTEKELVLFSITLHAITLIIFTLIVLYLFGFKISLIFSLIYILLPFNWQIPHSVSSYEFALLFFSLFFLFYFLGLNRKYSWAYFVPSGVFLILTCLSKETFFVFVPFFFVYLLWKKPSPPHQNEYKHQRCKIAKRILVWCGGKRHFLYVFIPFLILFSYFWLPNALILEGGGNAYTLLLTTKAPEELKSAESGFYMHLFPDPYTYHFEKEEFLENVQSRLTDPETSFFTKMGLIKSAVNNGLKTPTFFERVEVGLVLLSRHLSRFFSLEDIGGPFIFLLMLLGIYSLRQKNRHLFGLSLGWIISAVFLFSFVVLVGRSHLMDLNWILALFAALGIVGLFEIISQYFNFSLMKSRVLLLILVLATLYSLVLVNHAAWNRIFDSNQESSLKMQVYSQKIQELDIPYSDVIAIPKNIERYRLNYLTNKSLVVFREETIRNLLNDGELASALETFNVKYILGYSPALTEEIIKKAQIVNIADDSVAVPEIKTSPAKMWLMNLVK